MLSSGNNAKCAFVYFVLVILALITCVGFDGVSEFIIYNLTEPGKLIEESWRYSTLRGNLAALLIGFPALGLLIFLSQRDLKNYIYDLDSFFRRWVLYGAIALSSLFVFYGLVNILKGFLEKSLVLQTILLFGVLVLIALLAFLYFFLDIARKTEKLPASQKFIALIALIAYVGVSWAGVSYNISREEQKMIFEQHQKSKAKKTHPNKVETKGKI